MHFFFFLLHLIHLAALVMSYFEDTVYTGLLQAISIIQVETIKTFLPKTIYSCYFNQESLQSHSAWTKKNPCLKKKSHMNIATLHYVSASSVL